MIKVFINIVSLLEIICERSLLLKGWGQTYWTVFTILFVQSLVTQNKKLTGFYSVIWLTESTTQLCCVYNNQMKPEITKLLY